jgi:putative transposase
MKKRIALGQKQAELCTLVPEVCRKPGISDTTFWYICISLYDLKHMRQLKE